MSRNWGWLLALGLAGCGRQVEVAPEVALKHQYDASFQQQVKLLQAEQVKVSATTPAGTGPGVLTLEVINPKTSPEQQPDTLKQRVRKLAHLLVADLAAPARYQAVNAQATFKRGLFSPGERANSQMFIYSTASLR